MKVLNKIRSNKNLINGSLYSLYSFFGQGVSFVLLIILAKYIQPAEYGYLSLFTTITTILGLIFGLGSSGYASVVFFRESRQEFNKDFTSIFNLNVISALLYFIILVFFGKFLSDKLSLGVDVLFMAGIIVISSKLFEYQQNIHRLEENLKLFGILSCSNAIVNFIAAIIFVVILNLNWKGRIYSMVAYTSIFAIISIVYFCKEHYFDFKELKNRYIPILKWSLPLVPHLATNWIKQGLDRYIINDNYSTYEVGIFSFALNLVSIIISLGVAFNSANSVTLFQILSSKKNNQEKAMEVKKSTKDFLLIYIAISAAIILGGAIFTPLIFPTYSNSVPYFLILGVYGFLQCVYFLYCNLFFYYKNTKKLMYITFFSALLHLGLSLLLTRYSLYCTALIYLVSMGVVDVLVIMLGKKMLADNLKQL